MDISVLWAAILDSLEFDVLAQTVTISAHVEGAHPSSHVLRVDQVRLLRYSNSIPGPWTYAEITECRVTRVAELVTAELILWAEECRLEVSGADVTFDGVVVP